jgi:ribosomal protein L11 methylase PrmA
VYYRDGAVLRGVSPSALRNWQALSRTTFFQRFTAEGRLVKTEAVDAPIATAGPAVGEWAGVLRHEPIPFVSYPYEWSFSMLQDAARLQLDLLLAALDEDMTLKDASSFNIQWHGSRPVFIDIPSFEPCRSGHPWAGYRQFCQLFLYPLLLQAYKDVAFHPWLRGSLDGITPEQFNGLLSWRDRFRPGVFTHVFLQSTAQRRYGATHVDVKSELRGAGFGKPLIVANVRRLRALVDRLSWIPKPSAWSGYYQEHAYSAEDHAVKTAFVADAARRAPRRLVWDLGANTGVFSRIAAEQGAYVVAADSDHATIDRLYAALREDRQSSILPLVCNLADPSPRLGWRGLERKALIDRGRPDLVLCLALIHHMVITANIPLRDFVEWLAELGGDLVIEFVTKADPMVKTLLRNKDESYPDYEVPWFEQCLGRRFRIQERRELPSRTRILYFAAAQASTA